MKTEFATGIDLDLLLVECRKLEFNRDEPYIHMASPQSRSFLLKHPFIKMAADEIGSFRKLKPVYATVNRMPPHSKTPIHCDFLDPTPLQPNRYPTIERWHLAIATNESCIFWTETEGIHMPYGVWTGPVKYWKKHKVENLGTTERIHLIVDLDCPTPLGEYE